MRKGYRVSDYVRGKGTGTIPTLTRRRKIIKTDEPKAYTCNFKYSEKKGDGESVVVIATDYHKALDEAFEERVDTREPIEVKVIHPDIGRMLRILGRGAKVVGREAVELSKLGIKYGYAGAKVLGKEAAFAIARAYRSQKLRRLIEESYSPRARVSNRHKRICPMFLQNKPRPNPVNIKSTRGTDILTLMKVFRLVRN